MSATAPTYVAIDFGTTQTAAATWSPGARPTIISLDGRRAVMPSAVFQDGSELIVGGVAASALRSDPLRGERTPKRKLRHGSTILRFGEQEWSIIDVVAHILETVYTRALDELGTSPEALCLTRPVSWAQDGMREKVLRAAAGLAGIKCPVELVSESEAAARHLGARLDAGQSCLVYDLGGGTCDIAMMTMTGAGLEVRGYAEREIGGETFDALLRDETLRRLAESRPDAADRLRELIEDPLATGQVEEEDDQWRRCLEALGENVRRAKERLSVRASTSVLIPEPVEFEWKITRPELESLVADPVRETVEAVRACVAQSGLRPDKLFLAGAASAMPIVGREVGGALGLEPVLSEDPKGATALGGLRRVAPALVQAELAAAQEVIRAAAVEQARRRVAARAASRNQARAARRAEARRLRDQAAAEQESIRSALTTQQARIRAMGIGDAAVREALARELRPAETFIGGFSAVPPEKVFRQGLGVATDQRLIWGWSNRKGEVAVKSLDRSDITGFEWRRRSAHNNNLTVRTHDRRALFVGVPRPDAELLERVCRVG